MPKMPKNFESAQWRKLAATRKSKVNKEPDFIAQKFKMPQQIFVKCRLTCFAEFSWDKIKNDIKGTQAWEFCWLWFWIIDLFMVSYAKLLFSGKKDFIGQIWWKLRGFSCKLVEKIILKNSNSFSKICSFKRSRGGFHPFSKKKFH